MKRQATKGNRNDEGATERCATIGPTSASSRATCLSSGHHHVIRGHGVGHLFIAMFVSPYPPNAVASSPAHPSTGRPRDLARLPLTLRWIKDAKEEKLF